MNGKRGLVPSNFIERVPGTCSRFALICNSWGLEKAGSRGSVDPLKLELSLRNCTWRLCLTAVKEMAITTCLTLMHYRPRACIRILRNKDHYDLLWNKPFKGWGQNQSIVLHDITWFMTLTTCWKKMVPGRLATVLNCFAYVVVRICDTYLYTARRDFVRAHSRFPSKKNTNRIQFRPIESFISDNSVLAK